MSYGKLYILNNNIEGKWIKNVIRLLNTLYCNFIDKCEEYENGIQINLKYEGFILSTTISIFLINCYLMKYEEVYNNDGEKFSYLSPVNIVLDEINNTDSCLNGINTILNHPHFEGCKSINDINNRISTVPNLNDR